MTLLISLMPPRLTGCAPPIASSRLRADTETKHSNSTLGIISSLRCEAA